MDAPEVCMDARTFCRAGGNIHAFQVVDRIHTPYQPLRTTHLSFSLMIASFDTRTFVTYVVSMPRPNVNSYRLSGGVLVGVGQFCSDVSLGV
jgi:hypothetical protein